MAEKKPDETATAPAAKPPIVNHTTETVQVHNGGDTKISDLTASGLAVAGNEPANIPAATEFDPSGAPPQVVPDVDVNHPAVDADPRANTTLEQNRIDFNDPTKSGAEAVADMLNKQAR